MEISEYFVVGIPLVSLFVIAVGLFVIAVKDREYFEKELHKSMDLTDSALHLAHDLEADLSRKQHTINRLREMLDASRLPGIPPSGTTRAGFE